MIANNILICLNFGELRFEDVDFKGAYLSLRRYDEQDLINILKSKNLGAAIIYPDTFNAALNKKAKRLLSDPSISHEFKDKLKIYLTQTQ